MITNIINATLTAYCSCKLCCGPNAKGITANGQRPKEGITCAGSRRLPFGSIISYSTDNGKFEHRTVQDRLAKRFDSRFDIYFESHEKARQFGIKKNQTVTIITTK